ncbi:Rop guanine nucleotide exchange factor 14-like protein isoform X1, partial [Tanacetum coccineum]
MIILVRLFELPIFLCDRVLPLPNTTLENPPLLKNQTLKETLDAMTTREFWYEEAKGNYLMPQVPIDGLSDGERKKLIKQVRLVHQVFKAAKSINETMCAAWLRIQLRWKRVICQSIRTH